MRAYGRIEAAFWTNPKIVGLSDQGKLLLLYLYACPHGNTVGVFTLNRGYIQADLGWSSEQVSVHVDELVGHRFIDRCETSSVTRIIGWFGHNTIENLNVAKAAVKTFLALPRVAQVSRQVNDLNGLGNKFWNEIRTSLPNQYHDGLPELPQVARPKPVPKPVPKPIRNIEQEQEQEPIPNQSSASADVVQTPPARPEPEPVDLSEFEFEEVGGPAATAPQPGWDDMRDPGDPTPDYEPREPGPVFAGTEAPEHAPGPVLRVPEPVRPPSVGRPPAGPPKAVETAAMTPAEIQAAKAVIREFDASRSQAYGKAQARPWPATSDMVYAHRWLQAGFTVEMLRSVFDDANQRALGKGLPPRDALGGFQRDVQAMARAFQMTPIVGHEETTDGLPPVAQLAT